MKPHLFAPGTRDHVQAQHAIEVIDTIIAREQAFDVWHETKTAVSRTEWLDAVSRADQAMDVYRARWVRVMQPLVIRLPFDAPPLRSNDRLNYQARAKVVKAIRQAARLRGLLLTRPSPAGAYPIDWPVTVTLVWEVADNRVRDVGAAAPTGKAAIDGLVDAGVLLHDRRTVVVEERYRIETGASRGLRLEIAAVADHTMPIPSPQDPRQATHGPSGSQDTHPPTKNPQTA